MPVDPRPRTPAPIPLTLLAAAGAGTGIWLVSTAIARRLPAPLPRALPADWRLDGALGLLREGYTYIGQTCDRLGTDGFRTRIAGLPALCVRGPLAVDVFYSPGLFTRQGALPTSVKRLLQDHGSVATLDDHAHHHRKAMFLHVLAPARLDALVSAADREWAHARRRWRGLAKVPVQAEVRRLLCRAVCEWAGVPLRDADVDRRTGDFASMIDNAARLGPPNWIATRRRQDTERWVRGLVEQVRRGDYVPPRDSALHAIALHRDEHGALLSADVAAVELLNILRPVVAVGSFIAFAAIAVHQHPKWQERLADPSVDDGVVRAFVHEVRRLSPFFPAVAGRARHPFTWDGATIPAGAWVMLDLFGTNLDARTFPDPDTFDPTRFEGAPIMPPQLVPQGGGAHRTGHRCAGEEATVALMVAAVRQLTQRLSYVVPRQPLRLPLNRLPALPDGFVIAEVREMTPAIGRR